MNVDQIKVFAPATVANVACGFDIFGFAVDWPGDEVTLQLKDEPGVEIVTIKGDQGKLSRDPGKNTAGISVKSFLNFIHSDRGVEIELVKKMPLGSGLGSSAASSVASVFAANHLFGDPLTREELLPFTLEGEKVACGVAHADNVAPALLGGFVLIRSYNPLDIIKIPTPEQLYCTLFYPEIEIRTEDARKILKNSIPLKTAITQWGNIAGLIAGLMKSDFELIKRSLQDVIFEPVRSILIPGYQRAKNAAFEAGALGCSISGSGPSLFALSSSTKSAVEIGKSIKQTFAKIHVRGEIYCSKINQKGPKIIDF